MRAHINSKLFLKRIAGKNQIKNKEKIGYYDIKENKFGTMKIDSKNKKITIEDLHDKTNKTIDKLINNQINLELERSKLEDNFAKILDKFIELEINKNLIINEKEKNLFLKFFIFQAFTTTDNFENNKILYNNWANEQYKTNCNFKNLFSIEKLNLIKSINKTIPLEDIGIESINYKLIDLIQNKGSYFEKEQILSFFFIPIILNLENNKAFYTDKLFRTFFEPFNFNEYEATRKISSKNIPLRMENMTFASVTLQLAPVNNTNILIFVNKEELIKWEINDNILPFTKIKNEKLEKYLFSLDFPSLALQKPIRYIWFNNDDLIWIKKYFKKLGICKDNL